MGVPGRIGDVLPFAELARGGATVVYKARQESLDRTVLLKVLRPAFVRDEEMADRFEEEARLIARIQHPNVVTIHEFGRSEEGPYFVTEFVEGVDLEQLLDREQKLPLDVAIGLAVQAVRGLGAAHQREILHRDVKPANLLLSTEGRVKLTDFGLAASIVQQAGSSSVSGTPGYIAPELIRGESPTPASDLFGLGAVLYEAVTGRPAFPGTSTSEHLDAALNRDPLARVEMSRRLPAPLRSVLEELLVKDPERRIGTAEKAERRLSEVGDVVGLAASSELARYLAGPDDYVSRIARAASETAGGAEEREGAPAEAVSSGEDTADPSATGERAGGEGPGWGVSIGHNDLAGWVESVRRAVAARRPAVLVAGAAGVLLAALLLVGWLIEFGEPDADASGEIRELGARPAEQAPAAWFDQPSLLRVRSRAALDTGWVRSAVRARFGSTGAAPPDGEAARSDRSRSPRTPPVRAASLRIEARPPADSVQVNGRSIADLGSAISLAPGEYTLAVYRAPYPPVRDTVRLASGATEVLNVDFHRQVGWLVVEVNPWGVIFLDGIRRDTVPAPNTPNPITYMLAPGSHDLLVRNPESGRSDSVSVRLTPGDSVRRTFDLRPQP